MANKKISEFTTSTTVAIGDWLPIVKIPVTSTSNKKITLGNLLAQKTVVTVGTVEGADYVCNGTDDEVQIQAAIDVVNTAGGGIVHIKEGTYTFKTRQLLTGAIYGGIIMKDHVTLQGDGRNSTILTIADDLDTNVIAGQGDSWMTIKDLEINGNKAGQTDDTIDGNFCGIFLGNCAYLTLKNLYVHHCTREGIYLGSSMSNGYVSNIMVYDNTREGLALDFTLYSTVESIFAARNGVAGIWVSSAPGVNDLQLTITGGWMFDNAFGIRVSNAKHVKIIGTHLYANNNTLKTAGNGDGILVDTCEDVELVGVSAYLNERDGVIFSSCTNCRVIGGEFRNNVAESGIRLTNTTHTQIIGARCIDDQTPKTQNYGIEEVGTADYNTISNCNLIGNAVASKLIVGANDVISLNEED